MQPNFNPVTFSPQPSPATNPRPTPDVPVPHYPDEGCDFSPSCLSCPLPRCVEELTPRQVAAVKHSAQADRTAWKLHARVQHLIERGISNEAAFAMLAAEDGVTVRSIHRRLNRCQSNSPPPSHDGPCLRDHHGTAFLRPGTGDGRKP